MLEGEKATFEIFSIDNEVILARNKSDRLEVETMYSSKADLPDYYNFSKFANYCRDNKFEDLIALGRYVESTKNEMYISDYSIDDSSLYISFVLNKKVKVNNNINLSLT